MAGRLVLRNSKKMSYDLSSTQNGKSLLADLQMQQNSLGKQDVLG